MWDRLRLSVTTESARGRQLGHNSEDHFDYQIISCTDLPFSEALRALPLGWLREARVLLLPDPPPPLS